MTVFTHVGGWGGHGWSYIVILRQSVVMIVAFSQLQSQRLQSVLLVQSGDTFLDKRHDPERDGGIGRRPDRPTS